MRIYTWYCPELNAITFQCIMEDCEIAFEWHPDDLPSLSLLPDNPLLVPLGIL